MCQKAASRNLFVDFFGVASTTKKESLVDHLLPSLGQKMAHSFRVWCCCGTGPFPSSPPSVASHRCSRSLRALAPGGGGEFADFDFLGLCPARCATSFVTCRAGKQVLHSEGCREMRTRRVFSLFSERREGTIFFSRVGCARNRPEAGVQGAGVI